MHARREEPLPVLPVFLLALSSFFLRPGGRKKRKKRSKQDRGPSANAGPTPGGRDPKSSGGDPASGARPPRLAGGEPRPQGPSTADLGAELLVAAPNPWSTKFPEFLNPKREVKHPTGNFWTEPAQKFPLSSPPARSRFLLGGLSAKPSLRPRPGGSCDRSGHRRGIAQGSRPKTPPAPAGEAGGRAGLAGGPAPRGSWNATRQAVASSPRLSARLLGSRGWVPGRTTTFLQKVAASQRVPQTGKQTDAAILNSRARWAWARRGRPRRPSPVPGSGSVTRTPESDVIGAACAQR